MLYTFYCSDKPEAVGVRGANREAHLAFLRELGDRLFLAGPLLSEDGSAMVGSLRACKLSEGKQKPPAIPGQPFTARHILPGTCTRGRWTP